MGSLWVQVATHSALDRQLLDAAFSPKLLRDDIAGYEQMRRLTPDDPRLRVALGSGYLEDGRAADAVAEFAEAVRLAPTSDRHYALGSALSQERRFAEAALHFEEALRMKPDSPEALYGLGVVRQQQGRLDEAIELYRRAIQLNLHYANAHYNLGRALADQGNAEAAITEYRRALELRPDDAEAHRGLAVALASANAVAEAVAEYRASLAQDPDSSSALLDLSWLLATSSVAGIRDPAEAVRLAQRAAALTGHQNASVEDTLGVAYAAAGQLDLAIAAEQVALNLALKSGDTSLAARIRERLAFFAQNKQ
jgi:Flp pilus assembly protein TadD